MYIVNFCLQSHRLLYVMGMLSPLFFECNDTRNLASEERLDPRHCLRNAWTLETV